MPLSWEEVDAGLDLRDYTIRTAPDRMRGREVDPLRPVLEQRPDLIAVLERLQSRVGPPK